MVFSGREEEKFVGSKQPQGYRHDGGLGTVFCVIHGEKQALQGSRILLETCPVDGKGCLGLLW